MRVVLPLNFKMRDYQKEVSSAFFSNKYKRFINVWHRRAGKDSLWFNLVIASMMTRIGLHVYAFPTLVQARRVIWEGRGKDGIRFIDRIPKDLVKSINNSEMRIELVNGSILRLGGTDHYDSWMGTNVVGVVYSEYSLQNPLAWDLMRPILAENDGWAAFIYTPRSRNHGYELLSRNKNNPAWFISTKTVDDTFDIEGNPIVSRETIEAEFDAGMSEDMIQQEFYCSFDAALRGAIFSNEMAKMFKEDRIIDFPIDPNTPVTVSWDIGYDDSTCLTLEQSAPKSEYRNIIYYYENRLQNLSHYVDILREIQKKLGISYKVCNLPHDANKTNMETGLRFKDSLEQFGFKCRIVRRIDEKQKAIDLARGFLNKVKIHATHCAHLIECLKSYQKVYYEHLGVYSEKPLHNWASHGADSFMTLAQAFNQYGTEDCAYPREIRYNCVNKSSL